MNDGILNETDEALSKLCKIMIDLANVTDKAGEAGEDIFFLREFYVSYRVFSNRLRQGVVAILDMQNAYREAVLRENLAKTDAESAREYIEELFGDSEPETLNEEHQRRIRECVKGILAELDEEEEDE